MSQLTSEHVAAVAAVLAYQEKTWIPSDVKIPMFGKYDLWMYNAVLDDRLCDICLKYEKNPRWLGSDLRSEFPYLEVIDRDTIKPHTHMPRDDNCRCTLTRITKWTLDDIKWFVTYIGD